MVKKTIKKSSSIRIITMLIIVICIIYIYRFFALRVATTVVENGYMEDIVEAQCLLIKNEWAVVLPSEAELNYKADEGNRVAVGIPILEITHNTGEDENISLKITQINERIEEIKKSEADNNFFVQDKQKLDANIDSNVEAIKSIAASRNFSKLEAAKNDLNANVYKKSLIFGTESFSGHNLEQLIQQKTVLEQLQKNNLNMIYSRTAGLVSYELDGYEASLTPQNIKGLKADNVQEIINDINKVDKKKDKETEKGVKVVDNTAWYIAVVLPQSNINEDWVGKSIKIRFKEFNNTEITGVINRIDADKEHGSLVIIKTDEQINDLQKIRTTKLEIITKYCEGLIVPLKCIVEKQGLKGIYVDRDGLVKFIPIKIILTDKEEVLVANLVKGDKGYESSNFTLMSYDKVITSVNKIKEDQILPGAF